MVPNRNKIYKYILKPMAIAERFCVTGGRSIDRYDNYVRLLKSQYGGVNMSTGLNFLRLLHR